jgi:hypothetical protein
VWIEAGEPARIGKAEEKLAGEQQQTATQAPAEVEKAKKDAAAQISRVGKGLQGGGYHSERCSERYDRSHDHLRRQEPQPMNERS